MALYCCSWVSWIIRVRGHGAASCRLTPCKLGMPPPFLSALSARTAYGNAHYSHTHRVHGQHLTRLVIGLECISLTGQVHEGT